MGGVSESAGDSGGEWNYASAIVDPEENGSRVYFQKVSEPKTVKNHVHLDINVSGGRTLPKEERKKTTRRFTLKPNG